MLLEMSLKLKRHKLTKLQALISLYRTYSPNSTWLVTSRCDTARHVRVGHGSIFPDPIQSNPSTHGSNPIQSIKLPENFDPIQSNPKISVIKANSLIRAYVPLSIVLTINRGYSAVDKVYKA